MHSSRRIRLAAFAALVVAAVALPAAAVLASSSPKAGYYIDPQLSVYVIVGDSGKVKSFQGPCLVTPEGSGAPAQQGGYVLKKKLKISSKGKFSYKGKVTLQTGSTSRIKIKIAGAFKNGKAKGTVTFPDPSTGCEKFGFTGKYYGKHPQG